MTNLYHSPALVVTNFQRLTPSLRLKHAEGRVVIALQAFNRRSCISLVVKSRNMSDIEEKPTKDTEFGEIISSHSVTTGLT